MGKSTTKEELLAELTAAKARVAELNVEYNGQYMDPSSPDGQEWNASNARIDEIQKIVTQMDVREARVKALAEDPNNTEHGSLFNTPAPGAVRGDDIYDLSTIRVSMAEPARARFEMQERAKRAIEVALFPHERADQAKCKEAISRLLAGDTKDGQFARHLLTTGSPTYVEAFAKGIRGMPLQSSEISALSVGSGPDGGYAVPFILDPTVIPTSDQAVNPYRAISRVVQIVGANEWKGVSSDGVVATRGTEGQEATDGSPTFAQPDVKAERVQVFIPFSIELQQDWGAMQTELARMIQDAKDTEEAQSFTTGDGNAPDAMGILTGATITVPTAGTATFASVDVDSLEDALPPRYRQRAQFVGNRTIYNLIRHFDAYGGPDLWVRIAQGLNQGGNTGQTLHGYAANESSYMSTVHTSNSLLLVLGDFNYFLILDRIGMQMELIPHLFGTANNRPTGERGFYAYWRNNSAVLSAKAFRVLKAL